MDKIFEADVKGGRGLCEYCGSNFNNVAYHSAHECPLRNNRTQNKIESNFDENILEIDEDEPIDELIEFFGVNGDRREKLKNLNQDAELLQAVNALESLCTMMRWMKELNLKSFDRYYDALHERFDVADRVVKEIKESKGW